MDALLAAGAKIDAPSRAIVDELSEGDTPLLLAAKAGYVPIARHLIAKGAEVDLADKRGLTPLHIAVLKEDVELLDLLLKSKANVNAKTKAGATPLSIAIAKENSCAEILLQHGAIEGTPFQEEDAPPDL